MPRTGYALHMRGLIPVLLSLLLGLSTFGHGAVRLSVAAGTPVVLCTDEGAVSVTLDRNGNPQPATHHHCPDCLPLIALDATPATAPATQHRLVAPVVPVPPTSASIARLLLQPPARGPPAFSVV
jgi:hypothetical protein